MSSPPSPRRARRFAAKREAVLDAAMAIVIAEGIAGLTVGKVARRLDVAVGGLYRYFPSKEALMVGLQRRAAERFAARLDARLSSLASPDDPVDVLRRALEPFRFYACSAHEDPDTHRLMDVMLSSLDPALSEAQAREGEGVLGPILASAQQGLDTAADAGALAPGDSRQRTLVMWAATHGLDHLRSRDRLESEQHRTGALLPVLLESLLIGFGAKPEHARSASSPS